LQAQNFTEKARNLSVYCLSRKKIELYFICKINGGKIQGQQFLNAAKVMIVFALRQGHYCHY